MRKSKQLLAFFKSLKFRLILFILVLAIVPSLILAAGLLNSYESRAVSIRESEILSQAKILANQIATSDYMNMDEEVESSTIQAQIDMLTTIYDGRVIIVDRNFRVYCDTYNLDDHKMIIAEEVIRSFRGEDITHYDSENHYIEMTIPISNPNDSSDKVLGVMLISVSTDNIQINQGYLRQIATIIVVIVAVAMVFFGVLMVLHFLKPFAKISEGISAIKEGYGDDCLQVNNYTETAQICDRFNQMLSRMKVMDDSRQEFVSNVSHELKTPMTSMKVLADSLIQQGDQVPAELYREFMQDIVAEIDRENVIISDLLSLVKLDKKAAQLQITTVSINELLEIIMKRLKPLALQRNIELIFESFRPVTAEIDEVKLSLGLTNLIENGIKYNKDDGWIRVTLNADHKYFYVKVADSGVGIPEDCQDQVFDRFYRVDKARSRDTGGTGLGLAITKSVVSLHNGEIKLYSKVGEGTTFTLRIPLKYKG